MSRQHQIGAARQIATVQAKPDSLAVQSAAQKALRRSILAPDPCHIPAAFRGGKSVRHSAPPVCRCEEILTGLDVLYSKPSLPATRRITILSAGFATEVRADTASLNDRISSFLSRTAVERMPRC